MKPAVTSGGLPDADEQRTATVSGTADLVLTQHASRLRWHHTLVRRRRWSRELDEIVGRWQQPQRPDPWSDESFLRQHATVLHELRPAAPAPTRKPGGLEPWT